jgi:hypothetical protein
MDSRGNGRHTMFIEVTTMADGGGSVTREESGDDLLYTRVRWRGGSQVHYDGKVTVWRGVRQLRGAGTTEMPVAGGGKVGALGHGARGAWRKGSGGGRRCGARGWVHGVRTGGSRPASACGPSGAAARPTRERRRGCRSGVPGSKPVQPACFDRDFSPKI